MKTLHASGLHSTSNADVRAWVAGQIKAHAPAYLTHTEAGRHRSALTLHDGYGVVHPRGDEGQAECAIQYRLDGPARIGTGWPIRLSSLPIPRRSGDFCYATYAEFEDHHHLAIHLPSGVEGPGGLLDNEQARVYRDAIGGLRRFVAGLGGPVIISADWNLDLRQPWVKDYLRTHFPDFTPTAIPVAGGTHGKRFIDFSLVRGFTAVGDVIANPTSDHRALLERITPTPKEPAVSHLPATLPATLRAAGLKVVELDGWHGRGRPASTGGFDPVGVLCHHTATGPKTSDAAVLRLLVGGRSDLPGPLCNLGLGRDGTVYVIASGRANHAGKAKASGTVAAGDGNSLYIGIEAFNDGVGEPWPKVQYDAYALLCAALSAKVTGNSVNTVRAHKETSVTGKIDPRFDMDDFRRATQRQMDALARPALAPTRVSNARVLLEQAAKRAEANGHPRRAAALRAGLKLLPRR